MVQRYDWWLTGYFNLTWTSIWTIENQNHLLGSQLNFFLKHPLLSTLRTYLWFNQLNNCFASFYFFLFDETRKKNYTQNIQHEPVKITHIRQRFVRTISNLIEKLTKRNLRISFCSLSKTFFFVYFQYTKNCVESAIYRIVLL